MTDYFEDIAIGVRRDLGAHLFTAGDIVRYAQQFDPQRFHLSEEGAKNSLFGALCASGWHTASVWMKLMINERQAYERARHDAGLPLARMGGSPGFKNLRWLKPVYAGDTISYSSTMTGKRESASMPQWGIIFYHNEGHNQNGEKVFEFDGTAFVERRTSN